jgi:hypothetical protein
MPTDLGVASERKRKAAQPATACADPVPTSQPRIDRPTHQMPEIIRQRGTAPGRHHVGIPGDIISECPGDFVGIRTLVGRFAAAARRSYSSTLANGSWR